MLIAGTLVLVDPGSCRAEKGAEIPGFDYFPSLPAAHDLTMTTPQGNLLKLSDLKGKVVILNFWRENCPYCVLEKRHLKGMLKQVDPDDVKVLCVNFWDNPAAVRQYGLKAGGDLLIAARPAEGPRVVPNVLKGRLMGYYVVNDDKEAIYEVKGFPSSYVIDKNGAIVAAHVGMADWTKPPIRKWITTLAQAGTHQSPDTEEYALPVWLDRLLSGLPQSHARSLAGGFARQASAGQR
jgi:thiol-disulfide isomerase/thioredoxin